MDTLHGLFNLQGSILSGAQINWLHQKWSNKLQYTSNFGSHNPTTSLRYQSLWLMILQTRASSKGRQPPFRGTPLRFGLLTSLTQLLTQQDALFNEVALNAWIQFTDRLAKLKPSGVHGPGMGHTHFCGGGGRVLTSPLKRTTCTPGDTGGKDHSLTIFHLSELPRSSSHEAKHPDKLPQSWYKHFKFN